jgi:hypothetical protein
VGTMNADNPWRVVETPCYPCSWKVVSDLYRPDNAPHNFFATRGGAQAEADRRNAARRAERDVRERENVQAWYPCCGAWWEDGCQCETEVGK